MLVRNVLLLFLVCASFYSCDSGGGVKQKSATVHTDTPAVKAPVDTMPGSAARPVATDSVPVAYASEDDETDLAPGTIKALPATNEPITIDGAYSAVKALQKLFPGKYYKVKRYDKRMDMEVWACSKCRKKELANAYEEDKLSVPYTKNTTIPEATLKYTDDDGAANVIQAFATTETTPVDLMFCGRFSCAVLGLAWFRQKEDKWVLQSFEPALGCYGAFQSMPDIKLLKLGKNNYGCYLVSANGGAGGPYYGDLYGFACGGGKPWSVVLSVNGVSRSNTMTGWSYKMKGAPANDGYSELSLELKGNYTYWDFSSVSDTTSNLPKEVQKTAAVQDTFGFTVTRTYSFKDGSYTLAHSGVQTATGKNPRKR